MLIKKYLRCLLNYINSSDYRFLINSSLFGLHKNMSDVEFLKRKYKILVCKELNLENPETMNEKLQWLKLYDRKPEYTKMVDKFEVKKYVSALIGEQYIIPTIGVWEDPNDINFDELPEKFVLKCNHNSGLGMCICKDKSQLDINKVKSELRKGLKQNYYYTGREWPYKNVKPRIIAEQYMEDNETKELRDYKFYCFNGKVDCVLVCMERNTGDTKFYFFDKEWNLKRYNKRGKAAPEGFTIKKPANMDKMFGIAEKLAGYSNAPFVRVDLYNVEGRIYFGEFTFYPESGFDANRLPETDLYFGNLLSLPIRD